MIIGSDLMVKLGLSADFKCRLLQWDGATVPLKEPRGLLGKSDINTSEMRELVMQTVEPVSTIKATEIWVKIINITYAKSDLKKVDNNATQMNAKERTQLIRLPEHFEALFDGTLGYWDTETVNLELTQIINRLIVNIINYLELTGKTFANSLSA